MTAGGHGPEGETLYRAPLAVRLPEEGIAVQEGTLLVQSGTLERLLLIAEALSKSVLLGHYETRLAGDFDRIEPLALELEIRERLAALDRKLELVARTERTLVDLISTRHTLRVEWYIVILIVFEILPTLFEMWRAQA